MFIVFIVLPLVTHSPCWPTKKMTIALVIKISFFQLSHNYPTIIKFECCPIITTHTINILAANLNGVISESICKKVFEQLYVTELESISLLRYFGATAATSSAAAAL